MIQLKLCYVKVYRDHSVKILSLVSNHRDNAFSKMINSRKNINKYTMNIQIS